jgi:hypothetical protein
MSASSKKRPTSKVADDLFEGLLLQIVEAVATEPNRKRAGRPPPLPKEAREFLGKAGAGNARRKSYQASQIKRVRSTKDQVERRRAAFRDLAEEAQPATVRQI